VWKPKEADYLECVNVDGRVTLNWSLEIWELEGLDWIYLAQDREKSWDLVNTVANYHFPQNSGNFLDSSGTVSSSSTLLHGVNVHELFAGGEF
jgi:hypothetical protein